MGYAAGGGRLPSGLAPDGGIEIPDELPGYKLNEQVPKSGSGGGGGGSGLGTALTVASTAAKVLPYLAAMLPSDRRLKDNAEVVGKLYDGQKVYRYDFGDGRTQLGLMAQEVEKHNPDAVHSIEGVKMVDYDKATSRAHKQGGGGLGEIIEGVDYREMPEEERGLAPVRLASLQRADVMSDAEPIGLGGGARIASATPREPISAPPREEPRSPVSRDEDTGAPAGLLKRESGGDFGARNRDTGASGRAQFIPSRLEDAKRAGVIPSNMTMEQFRADKDAQLRAERWHFADVNKFIENNDLGQYVGTNINGVPVTQAGMVSVAHLGGNAGLRRFLETGGRYNPADANGTRLSDYLAMGAGQTPERRAAGVEVVKGEGSPVDKATRVAAAASNSDWAKPGPWQKIGEQLGAPSALRDERVFVPLVAGLGALLSSDKPRFSQALGEGLSGAAGAYGAVRGQTQDIERSAAETRAIDTATYQKSLMQTPFGNFVWLADGRFMLVGEYDKMLREGNAPPLLGRVPGDAEETIRKAQSAKGATAAPKPAAPEQPKAPQDQIKMPEEPKEGEAAKPTKAPASVPGVGFSDDTAKIAEDERQVSLSGGPAYSRAEQTSKTYVAATDSSANAARDARRYLSELASNLSEAAQGKGLDVSGFGFNGRAQAVSALNTLSRAFGGSGNFGQADSINEINKKIETLQAAVQAAGGNQESFAALNALKNAIASPNMSPRAYSLLAADLLVQNQRAIDRQLHKERYAKQSNGLFASAGSRFDADNPETKYTQEAKALQQMILRAPQLLKDMRGGKYTPDQIDEAFERRFNVPGMSRYFGRGM